MSRLTTTLEPLRVESGHCPVPELLVSHSWQGPTGTWWAGVLLERQLRVVHGPAGHLELSAPRGKLASADGAFLPEPYGEQLRVAGLVEGREVAGTVDQPGARGFVKQLTAVSRDRKRVRLLLDDGRAWWLRATGSTGLTVTDSDGRTVARRPARKVEVAADAGAVDQLAVVLLMTGIERDTLLVIGRMA